MAGFFCCHCGADETNPCDCFSKKDRQVSKPTTWGDVIKRRSNNTVWVKPANMEHHHKALGNIVEWVAEDGAESADEAYSLTPGTSAIVCRWLSLGCPPLTDPIPPEAPEPVTVTKVVRWTPTGDDLNWLTYTLDGLSPWSNEWCSAALQWVRDCQASLPDPEPTTPPDPIASIESRLDELEDKTPVERPEFSRAMTEFHNRLITLEGDNERISDKIAVASTRLLACVCVLAVISALTILSIIATH